MKNKEKKILSALLLTALAFVAVGCGKGNSAYTQSLIQKGTTAAAGSATSTTPTNIQGFWESTCSASVIVSWDFNGNGYWTTTDQYASSDCSDDQPSNSTAQSGTFQLSGTAQAGYAQTMTLVENAVGGNQTETGSVALVGTNLLVTVSGTPSVMLNPMSFYTSN
jgi:hypothetical protein